MSDNEHVMAIRVLLAITPKLVAPDGSVAELYEVAQLRQHVDALADELDEANARAARLRESEGKMAALVRLALGPHAKSADVESGIALARRGLHDGDLVTAPGDTTGERP